jgi:hypothetical protein
MMNEDNTNMEGIEFDMLNEADRLLAIAKVEQLGYNHPGWNSHPKWGPGGQYTQILLDVARTDPSAYIRAAALRALFHEGGEDWCFAWGNEEGEELLFEVRILSQNWPWNRIDGRVAIELLKQGNPMEWDWNDPYRHSGSNSNS